MLESRIAWFSEFVIVLPETVYFSVVVPVALSSTALSLLRLPAGTAGMAAPTR